jgi:hypothetical protein
MPTTDRPILLILTGEDSTNAVDAAFKHAKRISTPVRVLQILTSDLYHYGHQDLVATRPSKRQFLLHIREEVLRKGEAEAQDLQVHAREMGITLEICAAEAEDILSAALSEAQKGYDIIYLPRHTRKLFPLFKKTPADHLRKNTSSRIVSC